MIPLLPVWVATKSIAKKIPLWVYATVGALLILWFSYGYGVHVGKQRVQARWDAAVARGNVIVKELQAGQNKVTVKTETIYKDRIKVIHEKGNVILQQVPVHFNSLPELDSSFRVQHDSAATGTIPDPSTFSNAPPVSATDFASTITSNYIGCNLNKEQLISLQNWVLEQKALSDEICKRRGVSCSKDTQ